MIADLLRQHAESGLPAGDTDRLYRSCVPKSPRLNLEFRRYLLALGYESKELAVEIRALCGRDPLFFINTFCWLLEAREQAEWQSDNVYGRTKEIPFITRGYQDDAIWRSIGHLGKRDIVVPKSRETGVTWMYAAAESTL